MGQSEDKRLRLPGLDMRSVLIVVLLYVSGLFVGCDLRYGFVESMFQLSEESRLPGWFAIPQGYSRKDLKVTVTFYTHPIFENKVRIVVYGPSPERRILMDKVGTSRWHPVTEQQFKKQQGYGVYPSYLIVTVDGVDDIFEHRYKGNILYITDDPRITYVLRQQKPSQ